MFTLGRRRRGHGRHGPPDPESDVRLQPSPDRHAVIRVSEARMPGANAVSAGWNAVDAECPVRGCLCVVGMIKHRDPGVSPRMLLAHDLDLGGLFEPIDRDYLS